MGRGSEMKGSSEVPESMTEALKRTLASAEKLQEQLPDILSLSNPQLLSQMPSLQRAHSLFTLANITSTLFALKLRCRGVNPDDHPVKAELDRLKLYQRKLELLGDVIEVLPSASLNTQDDSDHSLPDLSPETRQDMIDASRGEGQKNSQELAGQKRKYPSSEEESFQNAAGLRVKKEPVELLGDTNGSIKEPIVIDISDDDDDDDDSLAAL